MREHVNAGCDHHVHTHPVLRMGEYRLALRMRHVGRGLGNRRVHVHGGLVAHRRAHEKLDPVQAHSHVVARQLPRFVRACDFRKLQLGRQIDGMAALWVHVAGKKDVGARDFTRIDAAAERKRVARVGAKVPHGGETPLGQHVLHVLLQRRCRCAFRVGPCGLREMDVTVPEAGNDGLSGAVDDLRIFRDLDFAAAADRGDDAIGGDDDGIRERGGIRRFDYVAARENEGLRVCGDA